MLASFSNFIFKFKCAWVSNMGIWIRLYTEAVSESLPRPPLRHPSMIMSVAAIDAELEESKLGSLKLS